MNLHTSDGAPVGDKDGSEVGLGVGEVDGAPVGSAVGDEVGLLSC